MMRTISLLFLITGLFFNSFWGLHAQKVKLDTNRMLIGEHNVFQFSLDAQKFDIQKTAWPSLNDVLTNLSFDIIEVGKQDTVFDNQGKIKSINQKIVFSVFDSGFYVIPSFGISKIEAENGDFIAFTDSLMLEVLTVPVDTTLAFKDIKGPMEEPLRFSEVLPYILIGILIIVLLIVAYYFYSRFKKQKPLFKIMERESIKPHEWALAELHKIKNKKIWQNGLVKEYYVNVTDVIRRYFEEEFVFGAMEMTSSEILSKLKQIGVDKSLVESMDYILTNADLAKFAKSQPLDVDNEKCMELALAVIQKSHDFYLKTQSIVVEEKGGNQL